MPRQPEKTRYLEVRRRRDETTALRRARATELDLNVWRRDRAFREAEAAAKAAPIAKSHVIFLSEHVDRGAVVQRYLDSRGLQVDELGRVR